MYLYNIHTHAVEPSVDYQVRCILNTYPEDFYEKRELYPDSWFSCGIHPWNAEGSEGQIEVLKKIAELPGVVAIGEAGLDKLKGAAMPVQMETFRRQIGLAIAVRKPLIIHCVKAWDELIALYKEYEYGEIPWIIHGYRGNQEQTKQLSKIGLKFSIGEKFNRDALKYIPPADIFCETDTSDVTICKVYENISEVIGLNKNHFATLVAGNVNRTFK
ncbi:TatD family deoxyribonuclease [Dysgonomonas sp. 521]|uniref:TatD family hydrolase n=1 Tax=Dysgonomonas sp. 521 TaxID=2302932 RepID=UPI0013D0BBC4|nr:TatD family hydrolase [Dysgonomonas sp. 521]NDV97269.1 TatD family deoxyribonuclease [Dysgonomonas sp. 521]